ncbi:MAG: ABC transporter ATP-binding protein [Candidatus Omnitrophota bacterium]
MLEARNIHKVYYNGNKQLEVLKGVNLKIAEGELVAVVGPSGAGKSTLLHILGGLDEPSAGEVVLERENIYTLSDNGLSGIRSKKVGFIFQSYHLLAEFTVLENVVMPALVRCPAAASYSQIEKEGRGLIAKVGLTERMGHFPTQLSGGEQQRVAIARALINKPKVLLCDEPTGNLDSYNGKEVISLIKRISSESNMAVVLVTHNLELAGDFKRIYHLSDGVFCS